MVLPLNELYDRIRLILLCALRFRATSEEGKLFPGDAEFIKIFNGNNESIFSKICAFYNLKEKEVFNKVEGKSHL
jgi:hypothetical protein